MTPPMAKKARRPQKTEQIHPRVLSRMHHTSGHIASEAEFRLLSCRVGLAQLESVTDMVRYICFIVMWDRDHVEGCPMLIHLGRNGHMKYILALF